jgi:hypothetical protein
LGTLVICDPPATGGFDFRAIADSLGQEFVGFRVSCWDSFERQREILLDRVEQLMRVRERFTKPEIIVASFENRREALGPGIDLEFLEDGNVVVEGHIWRKSMTLRSKLPVEDPLIQRLVHWLTMNIAPATASRV